MSQRGAVLRLYRSILRGARTWEGGPAEQQHIRDEAKELFRKNKNIPDEEVPDHLFEAETRIELAKHYRIPYARLYYTPKGTKGDLASIRANYIPGAYRASYQLDN